MRRAMTIAACAISTLAMAFDATIPVLDLRDYKNPEKKELFLKQMEDAAVNYGFFALTNTGLDMDVLDRGYIEIDNYFKQSKEIKLQSLAKDNGQRGFVPGESAKGEARADSKEFYSIGKEISAEDAKRLNGFCNVWPETPEGFKPSMIKLFNMIDQFKFSIGSAFGEIICDDPNFLNTMTMEGDCSMRANHYPANPPKDGIWGGAHTDINLFTILPRSTSKGLQIRKENQWIDVLVPDDSVIINCGDMLKNITNGYFHSAVHRVIDPGEGKTRYSTVLFVHPRSDDRLDPLPQMIAKTGGERKYANVSRMELLAERLIDLRIATKELMQWFVDSGAIEKLREVGRFSPKAEAELRKAGFAV